MYKREFVGDNIMEIKKLNQDFSVCKVMDYSLVNINAEYSFIGKTDEENSLVCITSDVPLNVIQRDDGWKGFRIPSRRPWRNVSLTLRAGSGRRLSRCRCQRKINLFSVLWTAFLQLMRPILRQHLQSWQLTGNIR